MNKKGGSPPAKSKSKRKQKVRRDVSEIPDKKFLDDERNESRRVTRVSKSDVKLTRKTVVTNEKSRGLGASKPLRAEGVILAPIKHQESASVGSK